MDHFEYDDSLEDDFEEMNDFDENVQRSKKKMIAPVSKKMASFKLPFKKFGPQYSGSGPIGSINNFKGLLSPKVGPLN